jgi:hypothetical protein
LSPDINNQFPTPSIASQLVLTNPDWQRATPGWDEEWFQTASSYIRYFL